MDKKWLLDNLLEIQSKLNSLPTKLDTNASYEPLLTPENYHALIKKYGKADSISSVAKLDEQIGGVVDNLLIEASYSSLDNESLRRENKKLRNIINSLKIGNKS